MHCRLIQLYQPSRTFQHYHPKPPGSFLKWLWKHGENTAVVYVHVHTWCLLTGGLILSWPLTSSAWVSCPGQHADDALILEVWTRTRFLKGILLSPVVTFSNLLGAPHLVVSQFIINTTNVIYRTLRLPCFFAIKLITSCPARKCRLVRQRQHSHPMTH